MFLPHPPHIILIPLSLTRTHVQPVDVAFSLQRLRCQLSLATTNALARGSLKDAANCVTHLELQISEKDKDSERILRVACNSRSRRCPQYAVVRTPKFGWYSHVVAIGADVIVEVSVPSFRAPIVFYDLLCLNRWLASIRVTELLFAHVHDLLRDYPLNLSI